MKKIPIHVETTGSVKLEDAPELPSVPIAFRDEADHLINIRFNGPGTLFEHLSTAYQFLDKVNREFVSTFVTCKKGCSHCCRMDVQMTTIEAEYIHVATGIPHNPNATLTIGNKGACPFLSKNGECSIYVVRPLFCRTYHSLSDPLLCSIPGADIAQYGSMESNMGNILYRGIASWLHFRNLSINGGIKDIRDFFPHSPVAIHQHLNTSPPKHPA